MMSGPHGGAGPAHDRKLPSRAAAASPEALDCGSLQVFDTGLCVKSQKLTWVQPDERSQRLRGTSNPLKVRAARSAKKIAQYQYEGSVC